MSVSLFTVGNTHLGKASPVKLSELNGNSGDSNATTRTYGTAGGQWPYKRVNSNEVARSDAPAPAPTGTGTLSNWDGYVQWSDTEEVGNNMNVDTKECESATSCKVSFSFARPVGYLNFHDDSVQQRIFIKPCLTQDEHCWDEEEPNNHDPVDPTTGYGTPNDGTSLNSGYSSTLQAGNWYIGTVRMQWNDQATPGSYIRTGAGYTYKVQSWPTFYDGAPSYPQGLASGGDAIIFKMPTWAICYEHDVGLGSTGVAACNNKPYGTSHAWNTNQTISAGQYVYQSNCSTYLADGYIAIESGEDTYSYAISGGAISGSPTLCGEE